MAIDCIDVSTERHVQDASPIPMLVWFLCSMFINVFYPKVDLIYFILLVVSLFFCLVFFQYKPRTIYLVMKYLFFQRILSPSFDDRSYLPEHSEIKNLQKILKKENNV